MRLLGIVFFCVMYNVCCCFVANQRTDLMHKIFLDEDRNYFLEWESSPRRIVFQIEVQSIGFVGLGFSPNGGMKGSDIVMAWFDTNGMPHLSDRYGVGNLMPEEDASQDFILMAASKNESHMMFRIAREYNTCDKNDFNLSEEDTVKVIWSYNNEMPLNCSNNQLQFLYHGKNRGTKSVYLLNKNNVKPPTTPDIKHFDMLARNTSISRRRHTIYMCHIEKVPNVGKKHHIIGFTPQIEEKNRQYVHHIVVFECETKPEIFEQFVLNKNSLECYTPNMPPDWFTCITSLFVWAIGSEGEMFPSEAGVPIGGPEDVNKFFLMEIHYDNSKFKRGIVDNSGLRFYYTDQLRTYDAGTINIGHTIDNWMMIPPGFTNFTSISHCGTSCLEKGLPKTGIEVISAALHGHQLAKKISVHHYRKGQELPILVKDDNYDSNYQQSRIIKNQKIFPGDQLVTKCVYDSSLRKRMTWGGQSSQQEMCLVFLFYYPKITMASCLSHPSIEMHENAFGILSKDVADKLNDKRNSFTSLYIQEPKEHLNRSVRVYAQNLIENDPTKFKILQENFVMGKFPYSQVCSFSNGRKIEVHRESIQEKLSPLLLPKHDRCPSQSLLTDILKLIPIFEY